MSFFLCFYTILFLFFFFEVSISVSIKSLLFSNLPPPSTNSTKFKGVFQDEMPETVTSCPNNCNNHGNCSSDSLCTCEKDYQGSSCSTYCPRNCSSNGYCAIGLGCLCSEDFQGFLIFKKKKTKIY